MLANTDRVPSSDLEQVMSDDVLPPVEQATSDDDDVLPPPAPGFPDDDKAAEDTNAVVSPTHKEFFLTRISGAFLALPPAVPLVVLVQVFFSIACTTYHDGDISALTQMTDLCIASGCSISIIGSTVSLHRATGTGVGRGQLVALGAGKMRISERARRSLGRAYVCACLLAGVYFAVGLVCFVSATRVGTHSMISGRLITAVYARAMFMCGFMFINASLMNFQWWYTLKLASVLVADAVAETLQAIERCSPISTEWEAEVLPRVLQLCDTTLPLLSRGYGLGVVANFLGMWLVAAGWFAGFLENGSHAAAYWTVTCVLFPLGISYDAASASSECDRLSDALNEKRMRGDIQDQAFAHAVRSIELILNNQNSQQGLGFTMGHRVMDLKTLGNIVVGIVGVATTAVPILFSLRPSSVEIGDDVCSLSPALVTSIQSVVTGMGDDTCSYNMTLNEILVM